MRKRDETEGASLSVVERLADCQRQRDALRVQLPETVSECVAKLEPRIKTRCADWLGLFTRNVHEGRAVLRALLVEPTRPGDGRSPVAGR